MNLPNNWEKKALIVVFVVLIATLIYSFNPFLGTPTNNTTTIEQGPSDPSVVPFPKKDNANETGNSSTNSSTKITQDDANRIATQANPGYTVDTTTPGSVSVNGTSYFVYIVTLTKENEPSKTIYIDADTGIIVM